MHTPVLLDEVVNMLPKTGVHVDATTGAGGHLQAMCSAGNHTKKYEKIIAIDRDPQALDLARQNLMNISKNDQQNIVFVCDQFRNIAPILQNTGIHKVNSFLFDLGVSSMQLDSANGFDARGFSFMRDEPLSMAMGSGDLTAHDIVNEWAEATIADALYHLADETHARRIANAIIERRKTGPIETTFDLVKIIESVVKKTGSKFSKTNPATKTFQALRMLVNDELQNIDEGLNAAWAHLALGGRIVVITFHSIEDRVVKQKFKHFESLGGRLVNKKPIVPNATEISTNKRARSAKLRVIEKIKT